MLLHLKNVATLRYGECKILLCHTFETFHHDKHEEC